MKLLIDAGNSRTKWAWLPSSLELGWQVDTLDNEQWLRGDAEAQRLLHAIAQAGQVWLSNVAGERWLQRLPAMQQCLQHVTSGNAALGLQNGYTTPSQLGSDRWCSLLAVWQQFARSALVVTAGTAMTIDALVTANKGADFVGGSIQPGLRLMWQSLQQGAVQLDYAYPDTEVGMDGFARNSQQAMWLGCIQALAGAVSTQYARLSEKCETPPLLVLSGGDAQLLHRYLPHALSSQAIIVDNLVLKGLACLAENTD